MADLFRVSAARVAKELGDGPHSAATLLAEYGWTFARADASTCATYIDKEGLVQTAVANALRVQYEDLDGDGVRETCGVLLEGSRTNLALRSEDISTTWVNFQSTESVNADTAPNGTLTADRIVEDTSVGDHHVRQAVTATANVRHAYSHFAQAGPRTFLALTIREAAAVGNRVSVFFNLATGAVAAIQNAGTATNAAGDIVSLGGGRYRCAVTGAVNNGATVLEIVASSCAADAVFGTAGAGDGTSYIPVWGGQFENNVAFPSSYIPTAGTAVTRAADSLTVPFNFGPMDLTVLARYARPVHADAAGTLGVFPGGFSLSTANPKMGTFFDSTGRNLHGLIRTAAADDLTAGYAIPAGAEIAVAHQYKNLATNPAVAIDAGSGYGAFSAGSATPFTAFGNQTLAIGKFDQELGGVLVDLKGRAGLVTRAAMLLDIPFSPLNPVEVTDLEVPGPLISKSQSGRVNTRGIQAIGRTWKETYLLNVQDATHKGFLASIQTLWRNGTIFEKLHVDYLLPKGVGGGAARVKGASQTGSVLIVDGAPLNTPGWLLAGDIFRVQGLPQVLQAAADVHTEGDGRALISLVVPLFTGGSPTDNASLIITGVVLDVVILEPPTVPDTSGQGANYGNLELHFSEAL